LFSEETQKRNDIIKDNFVINTPEDELVHNKIRRYGHIFRRYGEQIPKNSMSMELKENAKEEDHDQDGSNRLGNMSHRNSGRKGFGKRQTDVEAWLLGGPYQVGTSEEEGIKSHLQLRDVSTP
jgi:hypothetical protein